MLIYTPRTLPPTGSLLGRSGWRREDDSILARTKPVCPYTFNSVPVTIDIPEEWEHLVLIENSNDLWHEYTWEIRFMSLSQYLEWRSNDIYSDSTEDH